jgi:hypothetical protein
VPLFAGSGTSSAERLLARHTNSPTPDGRSYPKYPDEIQADPSPQIHPPLMVDLMSPAKIEKTKITASPRTPKHCHMSITAADQGKSSSLLLRRLRSIATPPKGFRGTKSGVGDHFGNGLKMQ